MIKNKYMFATILGAFVSSMFINSANAFTGKTAEEYKKIQEAKKNKAAAEKPKAPAASSSASSSSSSAVLTGSGNAGFKVSDSFARLYRTGYNALNSNIKNAVGGGSNNYYVFQMREAKKGNKKKYIYKLYRPRGEQGMSSAYLILDNNGLQVGDVVKAYLKKSDQFFFSGSSRKAYTRATKVM